MGWLRREGDCVSLVVAWAVLLQALIASIGSGAHAAAYLRPADMVLCTGRGAAIAPADPAQNHRTTDCCTPACRIACSGANGGIVPFDFRVPLPAFVENRAKPPRNLERLGQFAAASQAQPRAPPLA